jgi:hypothetical protein
MGNTLYSNYMAWSHTSPHSEGSQGDIRTCSQAQLLEPPPAKILLLQDKQFWFDDGSVIIHVEKMLFKVHRSILSAHSEIFADTFRMPQPAKQPLFENCPLVTLSDPMSDFVDLLRALYHPL